MAFDTSPLVRMFAELGESRAEAAVCVMLDDIGQRLLRLEADYRAHATGSIPQAAGEIALLAERTGLTTVARVARTVLDCAAEGDSAALGATLARLGRVLDRSLAEIWDVHDG